MSRGDETANQCVADSVVELRAPVGARKATDKLIWRQEERQHLASRVAHELEEIEAYLGISQQVTDALAVLSQQLFEQLLNIVQEKLTIALREILDQPIKFVATAEFKRGSAAVEFSIDRDGNTEDVLKGQGGSVANILSVGLRLFALTTLDEREHRRFLVLDEQDCWLRPDLVPKLVKIVHDAGEALGFQVIMISHHDVSMFERYADKIYQLTPKAGGEVEVRELSAAPQEVDVES